MHSDTLNTEWELTHWVSVSTTDFKDRVKFLKKKNGENIKKISLIVIHIYEKTIFRALKS